jgi:hypothetical protein
VAITARSNACATSYGTTVTLASTISVAAGDIIVVVAGCMTSAMYCTGIADTIGNTYTVRTAIGTHDNCVVMAYVLASAGANANNQVTATFGAVTDRMNIVSSSFNLGGGTAALEDSSSADAYYAAGVVTTTANAIATTGNDSLVIAGFQATVGETYSNPEIPTTVDAVAITANGNGDALIYQILTEALTNGEAEITINTAAWVGGECLAFKNTSGAAATNSVPLLMMKFRRN